MKSNLSTGVMGLLAIALAVPSLAHARPRHRSRHHAISSGLSAEGSFGCVYSSELRKSRPGANVCCDRELKEFQIENLGFSDRCATNGGRVMPYGLTGDADGKHAPTRCSFEKNGETVQGYKWSCAVVGSIDGKDPSPGTSPVTHCPPNKPTPADIGGKGIVDLGGHVARIAGHGVPKVNDPKKAGIREKYPYDGYTPKGTGKELVTQFIAAQTPTIKRLGIPLKAIERTFDYFTQHPEKFNNKRFVTIIDFSKPSGEKRMFIIDLKKGFQIEAHNTSHGSGSGGGEMATRFSNQQQSNQTSLGFFVTQDEFQWTTSAGYSTQAMHLVGLNPGINDNARDRGIYFHGSLYTRDGEDTGHSHGCFTVQNNLARSVEDRLRGGSLIYAYHPAHVVQKSTGDLHIWQWVESDFTVPANATFVIPGERI